MRILKNYKNYLPTRASVLILIGNGISYRLSRMRSSTRTLLGSKTAIAVMLLLAAWISGPWRPLAFADTRCFSHDYIGRHPEPTSLDWSTQSQGLAHDLDHWFVTNNAAYLCDGVPCSPPLTNPTLRRIPVGLDLASGATCGTSGVVCNRLRDDTTLSDSGYNHYGDPDFVYDHEGTGYVVVPIEITGGDPDAAGVAVFRNDADSLVFVTHAPWPNHNQHQSSWCAVDPSGLLVSSNSDNVSEVQRYFVDWELLKNTPLPVFSPVLRDPPIVLLDEAGNRLQLDMVTGGEFSDDGLLLYLMNGVDNENGGINVFQTRAGSAAECAPGTVPCVVAQRVEHSHNSCPPPSPPCNEGFLFEFHPGLLDGDEEVEGLTYWDLDADGRAPNVGGQLHVMLLHLCCVEDNIEVKHYRRFPDDTSPPTISCPGNITVECTGSSGVPASDPQLQSFFTAASASDNCDPSPTVSHNAPAFFPLGTTPVTFTATDDSGNTSSCMATVTVRDGMPPTISVTLSPNILRPPNHRLVDIVASVSITDQCDPSPVFILTSIQSDEPDEGLGDGDLPNDIQEAAFGTADTAFKLRAERSGLGNGRTYTVVYTGIDHSGNVARASVKVRVPKR